jgi:hypothetical protein
MKVLYQSSTRTGLVGAMTVMEKTMKRHEWWRHNYRQRRYLEHATTEEVNQRLQDLMDNMCDFTAEGKLAVKNPLKEGQWIELFTHVLEELELRGEYVRREMLEGGHFDGRRYVNAKRAAELWTGWDLPLGTYLLKFSKLKYLRPLLNVGNLRIAPASYYHDPSLNFSIRDSELEFTEELYDAKVHHPPNGDYSIPQDQWIEMPIIGNVKSTLRSESDYYIGCFSSSYEYRLYDDFEAEGCLVIRDIVRFANTVNSRMEEILPGWAFSLGGVDYRDPYHPNPKLNIFFCKHFRYAYQKEFRFVWEPPTKRESLKPIYLELGPLKEYCELLVL